MLGLTAVYVLTGDFHSVPPLWWLWRVSVPPHRGTSPSGCLWSCTVRSKVRQVFSNITARKVPDKIRKKKKRKWRILYTVLRYNHYFNPAKPGEKRSFLAMSYRNLLFYVACTWRPKDNFWELFSPSTVDSRDKTHIVSLVQQVLLPTEPSLWSNIHLLDSLVGFFFKETQDADVHWWFY